MKSKSTFRNPEKVFLEIAKVAHLLRWFGDPILRMQCSEIPVDKIGSSATQELAEKLIDVLRQVRYAIGLGRGLAAPQIGVAKRMFAVLHNDEYQVLINPKIIRMSDELGVYPEMCLSGLPMSASIMRPWEVEVEYRDVHGVSRRLSADPLLSRILQHEVDHLNGTLFIDKAELQTVNFIVDFEEYKTNASLAHL